MSSRLYHFSQALIFAILSLCVPLHAQEQPSIKTEITTLCWEGKIEALWFQTKNGPVKLEAFDRGFASPLPYEGPRVIPFYEDEDTFGLDPDKRPTPAATATLPRDGGPVILIFTRKNSENPSWLVQVIPNSIAELPAGAYRIVNLTEKTYQAAFDRKISNIKASGITIVKPEETEPTRDLAVQLALGKEIIYSSIWGHQENRRGTVFILPSEGNHKALNLRRYFQPVLPPKPAP